MTAIEQVPRRYLRVARLGVAVALVAGGALALSSPAFANGPQTLYVSQGGADGARCGPSYRPCASIQFAIDYSQAGDIIMVAPGRYNEDIHIDHAVTLTSDGSGPTIIDGAEQTQSAPRHGVVWIGDQGAGALGDVTVSGFTITNPTADPGSSRPESVVLQDSNAEDLITISDNVITGWDGDPNAATDGQIGVATEGNNATTVVRGNDISGVFRGAEFEDNGPLTFLDNTVHDVTTRDDGTGHVYPGQGVLVLSDSAGALNHQNLDANTFEGYSGIGIEYAAEFDDRGCASTPCGGSIAGQATYNTFDLTAAPDVTVNQPAAAIVLTTQNVGDLLDLDLTGNNGTVADALGTITEDENAGAISLRSQANGIAPEHVIAAGSTLPRPIVIGAAPVEFTQLAMSHSSADLDNARYDYVIGGSSSLHADQLRLEYYDASSRWTPISLVDSRIGITGHLGPEAGFTFPAGASVPTRLRISASAGAPTGGVEFDTMLDQVSVDAGHSPINTVSEASSDTRLVEPTTLSVGLSPARPTSATVPSAVVTATSAGNVTGGAVSIVSGPKTYHATIGANGQATIPMTSYTGGNHTIAVAFAGSDTSAAASKSLTFAVTKVTPTLKLTFNKTVTNESAGVRATVTVTASGLAVNGAYVTIAGASPVGRGPIVRGSAVILVPPLRAGVHTWNVSYSGTTRVAARTITVRFTVKAG